MSNRKKNAGEVTRDVLEGFIWAATGWRGDPAVIDSILGRVDQHVAMQVSKAVMRHRPPVETPLSEKATARIAELEAQVAALRQEADDRPPIIERITVGEILELLAAADAEARATSGTATRTINAVYAISEALRAADGMVKDIEGSEGLEERLRTQRLDAEFQERLEEAVAANARAFERLADDGESLGPDDPDESMGPVSDEPVMTIGEAREARRLAEALEAAEELAAEYEAEHGSISDEVVAEVQEVLSDAEIAEYYDTHDAVSGEVIVLGLDDDEDPQKVIAEFDAAMAAGEPMGITTAPVGAEDEPEPEEDPIAALVAEAQAEALADGSIKRCSRCERVKPLEDFYKDNAAPDGRMYSCKECNAQRARLRAVAAAASKAQEAAAAAVAGGEGA